MADTFMSLELKRLFLEVLFKGKTPPSTLWLGLSTQDFLIEPTLPTLSNNEPLDAPGYHRLELPPSAWILRINPLRVDTEINTFRNLGAERWPVVKSWFTATSQDNSGILLAYSRLHSAYQLLPDDRLELPISFVFE